MPVERWSIPQVEALAPDPGSLRNARGVTGQFSATGRLDEILWGLCRSYQVAADLAGPAFKCSCPSRKIPCKHVLGLLLVWATSGVGGGPAPEFATTWQAARAARAKPRAASTPDPVAAAKRAQERADRVTGGMTELRRWLDDQVEQGLAGFARAGRQTFEPMAARLVDAQAPGPAGALRRLSGVAGIGPQWADRVLGELAMLRLLVTAHDRLDSLAAPLAATVRSRIGFPTSTDDVLSGPRVTDRWQVLGQTESDDGALTTRRTWLRGAATGRFALVLSFAAPGQALTADLVPGTEFRGDLCFYPGSAPLRALVAERVSAAEPFASPDGAGPIRAALSGWASILAAEPWRFDAPMLLADVIPASDGHLVDAAGDALPLAPGHGEPWWLLAAAGAAPATVAAEWSPAGLRPLAAWVDGSFVPAGAPVPAFGARRAPELPPELLAAALVGTGRRPWASETVHAGSLVVEMGAAATGPAVAGAPAGGPAAASGPAGEVPPGVTGGGWSAASALLEAAAVALTCRRAGIVPEIGRVPVPAAPAETAPLLPSAASARLARILGGGAPGGSHLEQELLAQWLAAAAARGGLVPPAMLPALLDAGRRNTTIRTELALVAGRRGAWLAEQRGDWSWLLDEAVPVSIADWHTATGSERLSHLAALRRTDPDQARELVESDWRSESSENRARFLTTFATGLSLRDEPLLETALDDRRKEVREAALDLLRQLPGAQLGRRMAERAHAAVRLIGYASPGRPRAASPPSPAPAASPPSPAPAAAFPAGPARAAVSPPGPARLVVEPPEELDPALRRDGVGAAPVRGIGAGAWLLEEVVAGTPLETWTELEPAGYLAVARGHDWANPLLHGWAKAAVTQRNAAWAVALLETDSGTLREAVRWDLHLVLPPDRLAGLAADALRAGDGSAHRLLALHPGPWPDHLAATVLETVAARARTDRHTWQLGELCRTAALAMPPAYADLAGRLAAQLDQLVDPTRVRPVTDLARTLTYRHEMLQELQ
ncbi:SWIM zinc finger family protein [Actinoplanes aureus]|uniref:SWIM zinc finger family protein n=1 Tax=Actinoplanes aureus TaxID=2792083 RepID=A0A931FUU7_9ACTN|nr:SWIM zinc finger family protein [Actinoplanes aureus]MBG0560157.1 SWIM zinc finger family protein [Actinoplanes aureus]